MNEPDFDQLIDRRAASDSVKWDRYGDDVIPMWIADTDFAVSPTIVSALHSRINHAIYGYSHGSAGVRQSIVGWLERVHGWVIQEEDIVFLPGALPGISMGLKACLAPGDGVAVQMPIYNPIHAAPGHWRMQLIEAPLEAKVDGYDMGDIEDAIGRSKALLFCNPHNPTGKVYDRDELIRIAAACEKSDVLILSDEVHCDMVYSGKKHIPIATLDEAVSARTITLMSAGKTFNLSGLKLAFAIIQNSDLRRKFVGARQGMVPFTDSLLGLHATRAAFNECGEWRDLLVRYLDSNKTHLQQLVAHHLPGFKLIAPDASFLAWLDCRDAGLATNPQEFFLTKANVSLSDGESFGTGGAGACQVELRVSSSPPRRGSAADGVRATYPKQEILGARVVMNLIHQ